MHAAHLASGGRYPVLRSVAILCILCAVLSVGYGVWRAADTLVRAPDVAQGRVIVAAGWLAATFLSAVLLVGLGEMIKLFMDIEHNTRVASSAFRTTMATGDATRAADGVAAPADGNGGRLAGPWMEGEETAEGALIRGH